MKTVYQERKVSDKHLEKWQVSIDLIARLYEVPAGLIMRVGPKQREVLVTSNPPGNPY